MEVYFSKILFIRRFHAGVCAAFIAFFRSSFPSLADTHQALPRERCRALSKRDSRVVSRRFTASKSRKTAEETPFGLLSSSSAGISTSDSPEGLNWKSTDREQFLEMRAVPTTRIERVNKFLRETTGVSDCRAVSAWKLWNARNFGKSVLRTISRSIGRCHPPFSCSCIESSTREIIAVCYRPTFDCGSKSCESGSPRRRRCGRSPARRKVEGAGRRGRRGLRARVLFIVKQEAP